MTSEPSAPSGTSPHARPYRPFTVHGPYGAHRIYSYLGPWMPPMDYGVGSERVRYMQRLYRFYGMQVALFLLLIPYLCLVYGPFLAAIPGMSAVSGPMGRLVPIVGIVAHNYQNQPAMAAAISVNLIMITIVTIIVASLQWRAFRGDGYSDLSIMLYNRIWRYVYQKKRPLASACVAYYANNQVAILGLFLAGPTLIASWWRLKGLPDVGLFDGRIFSASHAYGDGPFTVMASAIHSHTGLFWLMLGQDATLYAAIQGGLLYAALWPLRRAAYRNDRAYLQARVASGLDDPTSRVPKGP